MRINCIVTRNVYLGLDIIKIACIENKSSDSFLWYPVTNLNERLIMRVIVFSDVNQSIILMILFYVND